MSTLFGTPFFWALIYFVCLLGIGKTLLKALGLKNEGWGVESAVGLGTFVLLAGPLLVLNAATSANLFIILLLGGASLGIHTYISIKSKKIQGFQGLLYGWPLMLAALFCLASNILKTTYNVNDDQTGYFVLIQQASQTGTLFDPFSIRRAGAFGGFTVLQAAYHHIASLDNAYVVDRGIAKLILAGLLIRLLKPTRENQVAVWVAGLLLIFFPDGAFNTQASATITAVGLAFAIIFLQTQQLQNAKGPELLILSGLAATLATLRPTAGLFAAFCLLGAALPKENRAKAIKTILICGTGSAILILPYSWLLWKSSGTPMLPPFTGNVDPNSIDFSPLTGTQGNLTRSLLWAITPMFLTLTAGTILIRFTKSPTGTKILYGAAILAATAIVYKSGEGQPRDHFRYCAPILLIPFAVCITNATNNPSAWGRLVVVALIGLGTGTARNIQTNLEGAMTELPFAITGNAPLLPDQKGVYDAAQALITPGEPILAVSGNSYQLDFQRNPIYNIDLPGACSPKINGEHLPIGGTLQEFHAYLQKAGIKAILLGDRSLPSAYLFQEKIIPYWENKTKFWPPLETYATLHYAPNSKKFFRRLEALKEEGHQTVGTLTIIPIKDTPPQKALP